MTDFNNKKNISGGIFAPSTDEFAVRSATSGVGWEFDDVMPMAGTYIGVDDALQVMALAGNPSSAIIVNARVLGLDGIIHPFQFRFNQVGTRVPQYQRFQLMEGWLLSATAATTDIFTGFDAVYVQLGLTRAPFGQNNQYDVLCSGYVGINVVLAYPQSVPMRTTDGAGVIRSVNQGAPAAGSDLQIVVPNGARWRLISFRATLTTAVAVANRLVSINVDDGATILVESPSNFTHAASLANTYNAWDSAQYMNVPFNLKTLQPLPSNLFLQTGYRINTQTGTIQAADQWSAAEIEVIEWLDNL